MHECDSDKGDGLKKSDNFMDVIYGRPQNQFLGVPSRAPLQFSYQTYFRYIQCIPLVRSTNVGSCRRQGQFLRVRNGLAVRKSDRMQVIPLTRSFFAGLKRGPYKQDALYSVHLSPKRTVAQRRGGGASSSGNVISPSFPLR